MLHSETIVNDGLLDRSLADCISAGSLAPLSFGNRCKPEDNPVSSAV
jgi:hypothetical protein